MTTLIDTLQSADLEGWLLRLRDSGWRFLESGDNLPTLITDLRGALQAAEALKARDTTP